MYALSEVTPSVIQYSTVRRASSVSCSWYVVP